MKSEVMYAKFTHPSNPEMIGNAKVFPNEEGFEIESFTLLLPIGNGKYGPTKFSGSDFDMALTDAGFDPPEARIEIEDQISERRDH